jgi:vinculin
MRNNKSCLENFDLLQNQWQTSVEKLQKLVDESLDCELFIEAFERRIIKESFDIQSAAQENNSSRIVANTINLAKRANRIIIVAAQEAENSEEFGYVNKIEIANESLRQSLPEIINFAKSLALKPNDKESYLKWAQSNEKVEKYIS